MDAVLAVYSDTRCSVSVFCVRIYGTVSISGIVFNRNQHFLFILGIYRSNGFCRNGFGCINQLCPVGRLGRFQEILINRPV